MGNTALAALLLERGGLQESFSKVKSTKRNFEMN
jgi:hypothetical protein